MHYIRLYKTNLTIAIKLRTPKELGKAWNRMQAIRFTAQTFSYNLGDFNSKLVTVNNSAQFTWMVFISPVHKLIV